VQEVEPAERNGREAESGARAVETLEPTSP